MPSGRALAGVSAATFRLEYCTNTVSDIFTRIQTDMANDHFSRAASFILAALLPLLLSGCFISEEPKFPLAGAAAPFGEGGRYGVFERGDGNHYKRQETFVVKRRADGAYNFTNEKGEALTISFYPLSDGQFISQAKADKDQPGYGYVVFRFAGNEALLFAPQCSDQDKVKMELLGVEVNSQFECVVDHVTDLTGLFGKVDLGEPISKMVRE
jgi:hypothetical protein